MAELKFCSSKSVFYYIDHRLIDYKKTKTQVFVEKKKQFAHLLVGERIKTLKERIWITIYLNRRNS